MNIDKREILAYLDTAEDARLNEEQLKLVYKNLVFIDNKETDTQGFITSRNDTIIISFRGSQQSMDWLNDFKAWHAEIPYDNNDTKIRVHTGFLNCYKSVRVQILDYITKNKDNIKEVIVVGHSLGGALATLCAVDVQFNFQDLKIKCRTSGSPKVGNKAFADSYNRRVPDTVRTYARKDIVPELPPMFWSILLKNTGGYTHVQTSNPIGPTNILAGLLNFFKIKKNFAENATNHAITCYKNWLYA